MHLILGVNRDKQYRKPVISLAQEENDFFLVQNDGVIFILHFIKPVGIFPSTSYLARKTTARQVVYGSSMYTWTENNSLCISMSHKVFLNT